jgi:hypothetical protein
MLDAGLYNDVTNIVTNIDFEGHSSLRRADYVSLAQALIACGEWLW